MHLKINGTDGPLYRRIADGIRQQIESGALMAGEKLPTVRELSQELGVSSGTIRQAYDQLVRDGFLEMAQGKGTFVHDRERGALQGRKAQAMESISRMINELVSLRFSPREIELYFQLKLSELEPEQLLLPVAVVECNVESLSEMAEQLSLLPGIELTEYLLSDIPRTPGSAFEYYALIVTTQTHYHELCTLLPGHTKNISRVVLAPRPQSTIAIARIEPGLRIGALCRSQRFYSLLKDAVRLCPHLRSARVARCQAGDAAPLDAQLADLDVLLVAPDYLSTTSERDQQALSAFANRGGQIIPYHYQIDQGSYLHIQERLKELTL